MTNPKELTPKPEYKDHILLGKVMASSTLCVMDVLRYQSAADFSDGLIFIDGKPQCFSIEDEGRTVKKWGETCVEDGFYSVGLRKSGRFHDRYTKKFPDFHEGMLCIYNAPNWRLICEHMEFQYILIHIGNDDDDTAGCLLTGSSTDFKGTISRSTDAYKLLYKRILSEMRAGKDVKIHYKTI